MEFPCHGGGGAGEILSWDQVADELGSLWDIMLLSLHSTEKLPLSIFWYVASDLIYSNCIYKNFGHM